VCSPQPRRKLRMTVLSLDIISAQSLLMASNSKVKVGKEGNSASSAFNIEQNIASESVVPIG